MTQQTDPTWEDYIIGFGKHKSKSIAQIWQEDRGYVKWMAGELSNDVGFAAKCVIAGKPIKKPEPTAPIDSILGRFKITFGKHSGKTMSDVWVDDPQYVKWLARESYMHDVKAIAQAIVNDNPEEIIEKEKNKSKIIKLSSATTPTSDFAMSPEFGHDKTLYPYQVAGAEFLERTNGCAIISDTVGLGKSAQALSYLQNHPELRPAIIVCPASVKRQWYQYVYDWMTTEDIVEVINGTKKDFVGDILILNYDILKKNTFELKKLDPKVIIFDEFHKIKNYKAQRTIAAVDLASQIPHKILLSGTPLFNRTSELWVPLTIIDPITYSRRSFHRWHREYCDSKQNEYGWDFSGNSNTDRLAEQLKSIMIRRTEEEVFDDLPEMIRTTIPIVISNRHTYNKAKDDHIAWIQEEQGKMAADRAKRAEHLTRIEYLKQLAAEGKVKATIEWISDYLTSEEKIVVFTHHKSITDALMKKFGKIAIKIDGSTPKEDSLDITNRFENDPEIKIFIGNMIAVSEAINLGVSKSVLFIELGWSPKLHEQCEGRIKGLRQSGRGRKTTHAYYLIGIDTIDVEIAAMLEAKREIADTAMDDEVRMNFDFFKNLVK